MGHAESAAKRLFVGNGRHPNREDGSTSTTRARVVRPSANRYQGDRASHEGARRTHRPPRGLHAEPALGACASGVAVHCPILRCFEPGIAAAPPSGVRSGPLRGSILANAFEQVR